MPRPNGHVARWHAPSYIPRLPGLARAETLPKDDLFQPHRHGHRRQNSTHPLRSTADHGPQLKLDFSRQPRGDAHVDIDSLQNTLQAHREANRARLVRKVDQDGRSVLLQVPSILEQHPTHDAAPRDTDQETGGMKESMVQEYTSKHILRDLRGPRRGRKGQNGQGCPRDLTVQWKPSKPLRRNDQFPWLPWSHRFQTPLWRSPYARLECEIRAFDAYFSPSPVEKRAADVARNDIEQAIRSADPDLRIDLIGSRATGLAGPISDIDLNISSPADRSANHHGDPNKAAGILTSLYRTMRRQYKQKLKEEPATPAVLPLYHVHRAAVPIITGLHRPTGLPFQIQCTSDSYESMEYTKSFLKEHPTLLCLFRVIKQMLAMRGLCSGQSGGLTAYPLLNMIVAALKFSEGEIPPTQAGAQLMYFLDMYIDIDFESHGISIIPLQYFPKRTVAHRSIPSRSMKHLEGPPVHRNDRFLEAVAARKLLSIPRPGYPYMMTLQDPANPYNDLGKGTHQIRDMQETFIVLRESLLRALERYGKDTEHANFNHAGYPPLLGACLGGDYSIFQHERDELRAVGPGNDRDILEESSIFLT